MSKFLVRCMWLELRHFLLLSIYIMYTYICPDIDIHIYNPGLMYTMPPYIYIYAIACNCVCIYLCPIEMHFTFRLLVHRQKTTSVQGRPSSPEEDQPSAQIEAPTCYFSIHREMRMRQARYNMQKGICIRQCIYIFIC